MRMCLTLRNDQATEITKTQTAASWTSSDFCLCQFNVLNVLEAELATHWILEPRTRMRAPQPLKYQQHLMAKRIRLYGCAFDVELRVRGSHGDTLTTSAVMFLSSSVQYAYMYALKRHCVCDPTKDLSLE